MSLNSLLIISFLHFIEHIIQLIQLYILHYPRTQSMGLVGLYFPWLMRTEILHYILALYMLIGIYKYRGIYKPKKIEEYNYWGAALAFQYFHHFEHFLLICQAWTGKYIFYREAPTSLGQIFIPRIELHFIYTLIVFVLMMIAVMKYPPINQRFS